MLARTFRGLDLGFNANGEGALARVEIGQTGVARAYQNERTLTTKQLSHVRVPVSAPSSSPSPSLRVSASLQAANSPNAALISASSASSQREQAEASEAPIYVPGKGADELADWSDFL